MSAMMQCIKDPAFLTLLREEVMAPIIREISELRQELKEVRSERDREISELREELKEARSEQEQELKDVRSALQQELAEVRSELNELEQYSRRSCLNISGIPETATESTDRIVRDVAAAAGVTLTPADIERSHRVGRQQNEKSRTIIVKLSSHSRDALYAARKNLRSASSATLGPEVLKSVFIAENLTKANQQVMYTARQIKRRGKLHSVWTDNCRMKVRLQASGPTRIIRSMNDLRDLVGDAPEFSTLVDSSRLAPARDPSEPLTPAGPAPSRDGDGFQLVGRGGTRRGRSAGRGAERRGRGGPQSEKRHN